MNDRIKYAENVIQQKNLQKNLNIFSSFQTPGVRGSSSEDSRRSSTQEIIAKKDVDEIIEYIEGNKEQCQAQISDYCLQTLRIISNQKKFKPEGIKKVVFHELLTYCNSYKGI